MKKFKRLLRVGLLITVCFILAGCGKVKETDKLVCYKAQDSIQGVDAKLIATVGYNEEKVVTYSIKWLYRYDGRIIKESEIKELVETRKKGFKDKFGGSSNISIVDKKVKDDEYSVTMTVNYAKMSQADRDKHGFNFPDGKEKTKQDFINNGYICE